MSEDKNFDFGICKIPRTDKDGNDITSDRIGKGGRHRNDGTYSGPVYDITPVDHDPSQPLVEYRDRYHEVPVYVEREPSFGEQLLYNMADRAIRRGVDTIFNVGTQMISDAWNDHRRKKEEERRAKMMAERRARMAAQQPRQPVVPQPQSQTTEVAKSSTLPDELDTAYEHYTINMTSMEAKKELFEAYVLHMMSAKKVWKVKHATITDDDGTTISGAEMFDRFCSPEIVGEINKILQYNPSFLEDWTAKALESILGRELVVKDIYIPFGSEDLRKKLVTIPA